MRVLLDALYSEHRVLTRCPRRAAANADWRAVCAPTCRTVYQPCLVVEHHAVHASSDSCHDLHIVAFRFQGDSCRWRDAFLDLKLLPLSPNAGGFDGLLKRHTVVDYVDDCLKHCGEYPCAARCAQRHKRLSVL